LNKNPASGHNMINPTNTFIIPIALIF